MRRRNVLMEVSKIRCPVLDLHVHPDHFTLPSSPVRPNHPQQGTRDKCTQLHQLVLPLSPLAKRPDETRYRRQS